MLFKKTFMFEIKCTPTEQILNYLASALLSYVLIYEQSFDSDCAPSW